MSTSLKFFPAGRFNFLVAGYFGAPIWGPGFSGTKDEVSGVLGFEGPGFESADVLTF